MFEGAPLLLLKTTGARSGAERVNPVMYMPDGDRFVVFASKGGAPSHPDWFHNLVANPEVEVEVGTDSFPARAIVVEGTERDELFARQASLYPQFRKYQDGTDRVIPVVILERTS
jgi:deazaflavin-dependent oxidoreductase (nitroreductase family)